MKALSIRLRWITLTGFAMSSALMASPPLDPAGLEIKPAAKPKQAVEAVPKIAICEEGPVCRMPVLLPTARPLPDMEANEESIQSILQNKEAKTTLDKLKRPIVLKSMEDANKHLTRASMEKIQVDFDENWVAIFAWQGSGQDKLHGNFNGKEVIFDYASGRTRDLRTHTMIYIMPKDAKIEVRGINVRIARCGNERPLPIHPKAVPDCKIPAPEPKVK